MFRSQARYTKISCTLSRRTASNSSSVQPVPPLEQGNDDESHSRRGQPNGERGLQPAHVRLQDAGDLVRGEDFSKVRRASVQDSCRVDARGRGRENLDEHIDEGSLRGRDHEGAADSLEEEKDSRHLSQIRSRGGSLDRDDWDLGCNAPADTSDDLIPDPLPGDSADVQCIKQPYTDGPNGSTNDDDGRRDAGDGDVSAAGKHGDGNGQNQRQVSHATHRRADVIDTLEVDRQVVDYQEIRAGEEEGEHGLHKVHPIPSQAERHHRPVLLAPLPRRKDSQDHDEADQQAHHLRRVPGIHGPAVVQREDIADDGAHSENHAHGVHLQELLAEGCGLGLSGAGRLEEQQDNERRNGPDGQVDVETPPPANLISKRPAKQRPHDSRNPITRANDACEHRSSLRPSRESDNGIRTGADARRAEAGDGPAHDERRAVGGDAADEGPELEDEYGDEEADLQREVLVGFAPCGLEPADGHEKGGAVPGDVVETVEFACDFGDGGGDDCQVQRHQEDTQHQGEDDED